MGDFPLCRKSHFPWAFLPVFSLFVWFMTGCAPQATPDLLELQSIDPPTLESGTELQIVGNGFPENRPGHLILKGTAYVPARQPEAVEWQIPLYPDSGSSIHLRLSEKMLGEQLKGAAHATFRGHAEVVFEPIGSGRPILRGTKKEMVLDLFTAESAEPIEAARFLDFLGMQVSEALIVTEIMKDSRAAQAGLAVGDKLHSLDHVRLDSFSDVVPQARAQASVIEYSREGFRGHAEAHIERTEFQILDKTLAARSLAAIGAVMLALLLAARPPRFLVWLVGSKTSARKGTVTWLAGVGRSFPDSRLPPISHRSCQLLVARREDQHALDAMGLHALPHRWFASALRFILFARREKNQEHWVQPLGSGWFDAIPCDRIVSRGHGGLRASQ